MAESKELRPLLVKTLKGYIRMSATVMIAVTIRLCLDCIGIILTGQEPVKLSFWFAHCYNEDNRFRPEVFYPALCTMMSDLELGEIIPGRFLHLQPPGRKLDIFFDSGMF